MRFIPWLSAVAVGLAAFASEARAQLPARNFGAAPTPPYSPYLNLVRPGANPAINYYGLVRPQMDFARSIQGLQGQLLSTQQSIMSQQAGGEVLTTGHPVYFLNYGAFFLNTGAGQSSSAGTGPAPTAAGMSFVGSGRPTYRR